MPDFAHMLRHAERPDEIGEGVALFVMIPHFQCGLSERLDHHGDGAFVTIEISHRQGNAFAAFVQPHHDEMPGLRRVCHVWNQHLPEEGGVGKYLAADDRVHRNNLAALFKG